MTPLFGEDGEVAHIAAPAGRACVQCVSEDLILFQVDRLLQSLPELFEAVFIQPTFKHALLDPDAVVEAKLGDAFEPARAGNVISDDAEHFFSAGRPGMGFGGQQVVPPVGWASGVQLMRNGA